METLIKDVYTCLVVILVEDIYVNIIPYTPNVPVSTHFSALFKNSSPRRLFKTRMTITVIPTVMMRTMATATTPPIMAAVLSVEV